VPGLARIARMQIRDRSGQSTKKLPHLIPLRLEECEVPDRLTQWQWIDLFQTNAFEKLAAALAARRSALDGRLSAMLPFVRLPFAG